MIGQRSKFDASPSPWWGGARGGGNPDGQRSALPPCLAFPHKGGEKTVTAETSA
jgi:hypothetical protein